MATRRKKNRSGFFFWKILALLVFVTAVVWYFQNSSKESDLEKVTKKKKNTTVVVESLPVQKTETKVAETQASESQAAESQATTQPDKTISKNVLSQRAWQDDYIKLEYPNKKDSKKLLLISYGLVPDGKSADKIRNPDKLWPAIAMAEKTSAGYDKIVELDVMKSSGDKSLRGIPRFKEVDFVDVDKDGLPEIILHIDSVGESSEKIGLLKWDGEKLQWMKKRINKTDSKTEKIALWSTGTVGNSKKSIKLNKTRIVEKITGLDAANPDKGFQTKTTEWKFENGFWVK